MSMAQANVRLRERREEQGWTQSELADRLFETARASGEKLGRVDHNTVGRWERRERRPGAYYTRLLCRVYNASPTDLDLARRQEQVPADSDDLGPEDATYELARNARSSLDEGAIEDAHQATHRLCRAYSATEPVVLLPRVQKGLKQINRLLTVRLGLEQQRRLLSDSSWLYLLLAAAHNDLGQRDAAWASRNAAHALGLEAGDGNVVAWTYETPAWFAMPDRKPGEALDYAREGVKLAPEGSSSWVMCQLKIAQADARSGSRVQAERDLEVARRMLERLPEPEFPDHHFVFDPPKLHFYEATAYAWLHIPKKAEAAAREVIRTANDPDSRNYVPTRVAYARLDLTNALLDQGRLDEATDVASHVFDVFVRRDTLVRAREVVGELDTRYPNAPEVRAFREQYEEAARSLLC